MSVKSIHSQGPLTRGLSSSSFVVTHNPNWHINSDGAIPSNSSLSVIAEDNKGRPVVLSRGSNGLLISADVDTGRGHAALATILTNYFRKIMHDIKDSGARKKLLYEYLFGDRRILKTESVWRY